ncbi:MAG TPA: hypothetical protein VE262_13965 [Blastocatellia bacterium]|nr:hypothetical protein [Blastocatellia bacterium]
MSATAAVGVGCPGATGARVGRELTVGGPVTTLRFVTAHISFIDTQLKGT